MEVHMRNIEFSNEGISSWQQLDCGPQHLDGSHQRRLEGTNAVAGFQGLDTSSKNGTGQVRKGF